MVDLKCNKCECVNNSHCNCTAKHISIDKQTYCDSYKESNYKKNSEYSDEISQPLIRNNIDVNCNAKCVFNNNGTCIANGISVSNINNEPECSTFLPK